MLRKVMLLAAMLAMVLAAAAPAFAQAVADDDSIADDSDETNVQYVDCSQVQQAVQGQYGDATAVADDESVAAAANTLGISQTQVNACLGTIGVDAPASVPAGDDDVDDGSVPADDDGVDDDATASASASASVAADDDDDGSASAAASAPAELPETGGASLLALGAGALLVAGGLVARRIVR